MSYASRKHWKNRSSGFSYTEKRSNPVRKIILFLLLLYFIYEVITSMFFISYRVESISMEPTIPMDAIILASPLVYGPEIPFAYIRIPGPRKPVRGDLVITYPGYHKKEAWYIRFLDSVYGFFTFQQKRVGEDNWVRSSSVKRVIGIPGDTIKMVNNEFLIKPEGKNYFFSEKEIMQIEYSISSYERFELLGSDFPFSGDMDEIVLKEGEYYLSGDNRSMSNDSYYWGPVGTENIRAKVILEYAPEIKLLQ